MFDAHVKHYREFAARENARVSAEYFEANWNEIAGTLNQLENAWQVAYAVKLLNDRIRHSPAAEFWTYLRETKDSLHFRPTPTRHRPPSEWKKTKGGNFRYPLLGSSIFSPWLFRY